MLPRPIFFFLAVGCGGAAANAPGPTQPAASATLDVSPVKDDLQLYDAGKGRYVALVEPDPERKPPRDLLLFWGDGKIFHAVPVQNAQQDGLKFEIGFKDPRIPLNPAGEVKRELGKTEISCWGDHIALTRVPPASAGPLLAAARFQKSQADWAPVALGKDGERYLYVDAGQSADNERVYRVFDGKKGALKRIEVSEGKWDEHTNVLNIKTAEGRVVVRRDDQEKTEYTLRPAWEGKKGDFTALPRAKNWHLIFDELGVYPSRPSPTPCDPMLP
jgi:hypothetical protein